MEAHCWRWLTWGRPAHAIWACIFILNTVLVMWQVNEWMNQSINWKWQIKMNILRNQKWSGLQQWTYLSKDGNGLSCFDICIFSINNYQIFPFVSSSVFLHRPLSCLVSMFPDHIMLSWSSYYLFKYLLNIYYVPGIILGIWKTSVRTKKASPMWFTSGEQTEKQQT